MKLKKIKTILSISIAVLLLIGISACGKTIGTGGDKPEGGVVEVTEAASTDPSANKETTDSKEAKNETTTASNSDASQQENTDDNSNWDDGYWDDNYNGGGTSGSDQPVPPAETPTDPPAPTWTISVSVDAGEFGGLFGSGTYTFYYQPTAYDALVATGIAHNARTSIYGVYVSSINGLAEFDYGGESGWHYSVNDVEPGIGCSEYYLNDGDYVYWNYRDSIY